MSESGDLPWGDVAPSRSGTTAMVCRALKISRPKPRSPKPIGMRRFPAVSIGIRFWESARERAIQSGNHSLGRMAVEIAEAHRSAWARFEAEEDCRCPTCGGAIGLTAGPGRGRAPAENVAYARIGGDAALASTGSPRSG
jgi:hypothetical protein